MVLQGRKVTGTDIELIRVLLAEHPARGRTPLSQELCRCWNWRNAQGRLKGLLSKTLCREMIGREFGFEALLKHTDQNGAMLRRAIRELMPEAIRQRCYVHFLRNALDYLPRKADDDCLRELRRIYDRQNIEEARRDLAAWLKKRQVKYAKLCDWVAGNIEETLIFYRLPRRRASCFCWTPGKS